MYINFTDLRGRTLMIKFTCGRCGKTHIEPINEQYDGTEGNIQSFKPPEGWLDDGVYNPMLCDECNDVYQRFLKNKPIREGE